MTPQELSDECECCGQSNVSDCCRPVSESKTIRIDRLGNVWTCFKSRWGNGPWRKCKLQLSRPPYPKLVFKVGGKQRCCSIHVLMMETFVGPRPSGNYACHNDGNPQNNCLSNLRWATPRENQLDRIRHDRGPLGERNPTAKLTEKKVLEIRQLAKAGLRQSDLVQRYAVCPEAIRKIVNRISWTHI